MSAVFRTISADDWLQGFRMARATPNQIREAIRQRINQYLGDGSLASSRTVAETFSTHRGIEKRREALAPVQVAPSICTKADEGKPPFTD